MDCLLCLGVDVGIQVDSIEWQEQNIKELIYKHLWPIKPLTSNPCICLTCWKDLNDFHKFYTRVEDAHNDVKNIVKTEKDPLEDELRDEALIEPQILIGQGSNESNLTKEENEAEMNPIHFLEKIQIEPDIVTGQEDSNMSILTKQEHEEGSVVDSYINIEICDEEHESQDRSTDNNFETDGMVIGNDNHECSSDSSNTDSDDDFPLLCGKPKKKAPKREALNDTHETEAATMIKHQIPKMNKSEYDGFLKEHFKITCNECQQPFENFQLLSNHYKTEHNERAYVICCETKFFYRNLLVDHVHCHLDPNYFKCLYCGNTFTQRQCLQGHLKLHEERKYACSMCDKKFVYKYMLENHEYMHKKRKSEQASRENDDTDKANSETAGNVGNYVIPKTDKLEADAFLKEHFKIVCDKCHQRFDNFQLLCDHFSKEHKERGYVICCKTKYSYRYLLVDHVHTHLNPDFFKCVYCQKILKNRESLQRHLKFHQGDFKHCCDLCEKKFTLKYLLDLHKKSHLPPTEKTIRCNDCGKMYSSNNSLTRHQRSVHLNAYAKICEVCGLSVPDATALKHHMRKHDPNARPVKCDDCGLLVTSEFTLKYHKKLKHPVGGSREYTCQICMKVSPTYRAHKEHVKIKHVMGYKHKCTLCDKQFKLAYTLKIHMLTHTGGENYKCPWCPQEFNNNGSFYIHRRKFHPVEWEESQRKKYSGNLPPNFKPLK